MKIFHCVESYFPAIGGMQEVVKQLSEKLAAAGHEVTVLTRFHPERTFTEWHGVKIVPFNISGNPTVAVTEHEKEYVSYLLNNTSDIITFFAAQQWATDLALPVLNQLKAKKVSVPTGYSGLYNPSYKHYFNRMKTDIHGYDMNVYLSDDYRDINFARENKVPESRIVLIPNGASEEEFEGTDGSDFKKKHGIPEDDFLILHVGSYTGEKGHKEAVSIFLNADIKDATILFIGNKYEYFLKRGRFKRPLLLLKWAFAGLKNKKIRFSFFSREDTVKAFKSADLFLFPSNIECSPIVLFEAMAGHTAFLASDVGNSKEIATWSKGGLILPTTFNKAGRSHASIPESARILEGLYRDRKQLKELSDNGYASWKQKFTWEIIAKRYEKLYFDLIKQS